jgi:hypothetical protein
VVCPGFFSIALLRPPLERLVSHSVELARWGMVVQDYKLHPNGTFDKSTLHARAVVGTGSCRDYSHLRALAPPVYDNYYVRMLLGEQGIAAPVGSLTRAHLAHAKRVLSTLDLILDSNEPRTPLAVQYATGIANFTSCRKPKRLPPRHSCTMSAVDSARAARDNKLDLELYAFALELSERQVTKILKRAAHV